MYNDTVANELNHIHQRLQITADYVDQCIKRSNAGLEIEPIGRIKEVLFYDLERIEKSARSLKA